MGQAQSHENPTVGFLLEVLQLSIKGRQRFQRDMAHCYITQKARAFVTWRNRYHFLFSYIYPKGKDRCGVYV